MPQRIDVRSRRHQVGRCDDSVEVVQGDEWRRPIRHGEILAQHRVNIEAASRFGLVRLAVDRVHHVCASCPVIFAAGKHRVRDGPRHLGQNRLQAAHHRLEEADAASERAVHVRLDRSLVMQVDDANDRMLLAEPVDASDALLDPHRIPRHVVVDEGSAELEIEALRGGVGAEQNVSLAKPKTALRVVPADSAPGAVRGRDFAASPGEAHQS